MPLPKCTGPFHVGFVDLMTAPKHIPNDLTLQSLCSNETDLGSFSRIYYPCQPPESKVRLSNWLPGKDIYIKSLMKSVGIGWLTPLVKLFTRNVKQEAFLNAPIINHPSWQATQQHEYLKNKASLPLLIFSHGLLGARYMYSAFCTQLASEGFIVAIVEHRDGSSSATYTIDKDNNCVEIPYSHFSTEDGNEENIKLRNQQVNRRQLEVSNLLTIMETLNENPDSVSNIYPTSFDLKSFQGRIDTSQPLIMGHSFGGATVVHALNKDDRFKCGIGLDIWFQPVWEEVYMKDNGFKKPILMIYTEFFNWKNNLKQGLNYFDSKPKDYVEMITLKGTIHMDQCDIPGITPWYLSKYAGGHSSERIDFAFATNLQRQIIMHYFGKYLNLKEWPVKLLSEDFALPDDFIVGSNISLNEDENS